VSCIPVVDRLDHHALLSNVTSRLDPNRKRSPPKQLFGHDECTVGLLAFFLQALPVVHQIS